MEKTIKLTLSISAVALMAACGGGGGSSGDTSANPQVFTAAAAKGELISYEIDPNLLTYSYTITSSAYGLSNTPRTGTLTYNAVDDTYTPNGMSGKIAYNSAGLLFGVIKENFGSGIVSVPVFGMKTLEKQIANVADTYNYVSYQCIASSPCTSLYGTIRVNNNGMWQLCQGANLSAGSLSCAVTLSGTGSIDSSTGKITLTDSNSNTTGTALTFASNGQKVFVIDLTGGTSTLGKGMVVASAQNNAPSSMDGTWRYIRTSETGRLVINGTTINQTIDGVGSGSSTFTPNQPWTGFATTQNGNIALAAGSGMYAASFTDGNFSVGLKRD